MSNDVKIGVAISGGGHRAALFGLGALLFLIDAGKGRQLGSISSVSGGSLTNAHFGRIDLTAVEPDEAWAHGKQLASQIVRRGTLWAAPLTYLYLVCIPLVIVAAVVVGHLGVPWATASAWVAAILLCAWLSQQRSFVAAMAFDRTLLRKSQRYCQYLWMGCCPFSADLRRRRVFVIGSDARCSLRAVAGPALVAAA